MRARDRAVERARIERHVQARGWRARAVQRVAEHRRVRERRLGEVRVALAQRRRGRERLAARRGADPHDDDVVGRHVREPRQHAALREIELERRAQVELPIEPTDELERVATDVQAWRDRSAEARAQKARACDELLGKRRDVGPGARVADRQRRPRARERTGGRDVRVAARRLAETLDPTLRDEARLAQHDDVGRGEPGERLVEGRRVRRRLDDLHMLADVRAHRVEALAQALAILARGDDDRHAARPLGSTRLGQLVHAHRSPPVDQPA